MHDLRRVETALWCTVLRDAGWAEVANEVFERGTERVCVAVARAGRIAFCMSCLTIEVDERQLVDWVVRRLR
jgi:hypothetical protein